MDFRILAVCITGTAGAALLAYMVAMPFETPDSQRGFAASYEGINEGAKRDLAIYDIMVSTPIRLAEPKDIAEFCGFAGMTEYCTSTELRGPDDVFLGNIHLFGSASNPEKAIAAVQLDSMFAQKSAAKRVFEALTRNTACPCWHEGEPSMDQWAEAHISYHQSTGAASTSSDVLRIREYDFKIKMTANDEGYEWQLVIS